MSNATTIARYRTILFDLDGTLIDSSACIVACARHAFEAHGLPAPTPQAVRARMGVPLEVSIGQLDPRAKEPTLRDAVIAAYRAHYREVAAGSITAFDGVADMLAAVKAAGAKVAVVTSKKSGPAEDNCRSLGLIAWIDAIVGSDTGGRYKPHPDPAIEGLRRLGASADGAVVVGDATFDVEMGRAAGLDTCAVTWGAHDEAVLLASGPTHLARTIDELVRVLVP